MLGITICRKGKQYFRNIKDYFKLVKDGRRDGASLQLGECCLVHHCNREGGYSFPLLSEQLTLRCKPLRISKSWIMESQCYLGIAFTVMTSAI